MLKYQIIMNIVLYVCIGIILKLFNKQSNKQKNIKIGIGVHNCHLPRSVIHTHHTWIQQWRSRMWYGIILVMLFTVLVFSSKAIVYCIVLYCIVLCLSYCVIGLVVVS